MFGAVESERNRQLASGLSDIGSMHPGRVPGQPPFQHHPHPHPHPHPHQQQQLPHHSNDSLVDLSALDTKSRVGMKETDLSLLNKQSKRRPGGSLASAASQHLKTRPSSPNMNNGAFNPNNSRVNSMSSVSSGGKSPLNPRFSSSPRSSAVGALNAPHGFFPPRRGGPNGHPGSPSSPQFPNPPRMSSIEIIVMEEKIKELQSQIMAKDDQLRKSLSMQFNNNPVIVEKTMKQYASLEQENVVLSRELNEKNKELVNKLKQLQQKDEVISEMEAYTNEQYNKLVSCEDSLSQKTAECEASIAKLEHNLKKAQEESEANKNLLSKANSKVEEANENLIKQRHNIKFEYDAIIENKMNANEKLSKQVEGLKEQLIQREQDKSSDVQDYQLEIEAKKHEAQKLYNFLVDFVKDVNIYIPVNVLKDKMTIINENELLARINSQNDALLTKLFEASMNDIIYPASFNPHSPDSVNNSDISPSVFSDVPVAYTHQNNSYVTSISRSSSIYSKQNKSQDHLSGSKSVESTTSEKEAHPEEPAVSTEEPFKKDNKIAQLSHEDLLKSTLQELKTAGQYKESNYQSQIKHLNDNLAKAKYLIAKLSYTSSYKHKQHHSHIQRRQQQLLKLSNSLSSLLLSASPDDQTPIPELSPSGSVLSFTNLGAKVIDSNNHFRDDSFDRFSSSRSSKSRFSNDLSNISSSTNSESFGRSGLRILNVIPPVLTEQDKLQQQQMLAATDDGSIVL